MKHQQICGIINLNESMHHISPITAHRPIASLPFCGRYRLIDFPLSNLTHAGIASIGVFTNKHYRSLYNHVRSGSDWDIEGTSGGLFFFGPDTYPSMSEMTVGDLPIYYNNLEFIEKSGAEYVIVMGSRTLCNLDVHAILRHHEEQNAELTVVYKTVKSSRIHSLSKTCFRVNRYGEIYALSPCSSQNDQPILANMEIYFMRCSLFTKLVRHFMASNELYNLRDALHQFVSDVETNGFEYTGYMRTIHSVQDYYEANMDMLSESNRNALICGNHPIETRIKNEAPTYYGNYATQAQSLVANGCIIDGVIRESIFGRKSKVMRDAEIESSILMDGCIIGSGAYLKHVILDNGTYIAPHTQLIGSEKHPIVLDKKVNAGYGHFKDEFSTRS
ncbi:glucose-1-phosphate adenylyltransferase subunit GlgD [Sporolactobacillus kofuensis]|uniref:Glucose-1-phosphate adenylyltransferase subunit GlgD n=1 Tax=Sporolactobacillus kofuensis TaxID=269672 RepID=A0ABW1WJ70_9BACL|nr:glucose-1-phosphate adenylyltransferase subunit GlgD [Sporolactobacillus kofuensis]MCO7176570.1 glucose-1-phosphate adenylyltransferase subunit GlgD [Sporolactobacillus kofuensis]